VTINRKMFLPLAIALPAALAHAQGYELVWSDEFDGTELDTTSWQAQTGTGTAYGLPAGWGNNELQYYTNFSDNLSVSDGTLKITARQQNLGGQPYTSARIRTQGMRDFLYGRIEGRMKVPSTSGVWPAFWMLPTNSPYGGWASSGEIDIMESVNTANSMHGTIHFGNNWPNNQSNGGSLNNGTDFSNDFHVYSIEWEPDQIRWYIDGQQYHSVNSNQWFSNAAPSNVRAPFDSQFHLLLNVAVGGNWPGNPNGSASYPQTLEVDYVRVYQQNHGPFGDGPAVIPGRIEAEDFDNGFNGQSYQDCDATNNGGAYRSTGVDIEAASEGGFNVGWICEGEWLQYSVDVQTAGTYNVTARVASLNSFGSFHLESDGVEITDSIVFFSSNGWQDWIDVSTQVELEAGPQVLRFVNDGDSSTEYNFNALTFDLVPSGGCTEADYAEPFNQLNFLDVSAFLSLFAEGNLSADLTDDGNLNFLDVSAFLTLFGNGCP
jgi:beta-glucanase (GH16 family)